MHATQFVNLILPQTTQSFVTVDPLPLVCKMPWENGISLLHGSMAGALISSWDASAANNASDVGTAVLVRLAETLDSVKFSSALHQDPRTRELFCRLSAMSRREFVRANGWKGICLADLAIISHFVAGLNTLDHLCEALSVPRQPSVPVMRPLPYPYPFPDRLNRILKNLKSWIYPIQNLQRIVDTADREQQIMASAGLEIQLPVFTSPAASMVYHEIQNFLRAFRYNQESKLVDVLINAVLLGSSIGYFAKAKCDLPETAPQLGRILESHAESAGLPLPAGFRKEFDTPDADMLLNRMKTAFHIAATITPLAILLPMKWSKEPIGRQHLLTIMSALGNQRPEQLRQVELALWRALLRIASGSNAEKEIKAFLAEFAELNRQWDLDGVTELDLEFFQNRTEQEDAGPSRIIAPAPGTPVRPSSSLTASLPPAIPAGPEFCAALDPPAIQEEHRARESEFNVPSTTSSMAHMMQSNHAANRNHGADDPSAHLLAPLLPPFRQEPTLQSQHAAYSSIDNPSAHQPVPVRCSYKELFGTFIDENKLTPSPVNIRQRQRPFDRETGLSEHEFEMAVRMAAASQQNRAEDDARHEQDEDVHMLDDSQANPMDVEPMTEDRQDNGQGVDEDMFMLEDHEVNPKDSEPKTEDEGKDEHQDTSMLDNHQANRSQKKAEIEDKPEQTERDDQAHDVGVSSQPKDHQEDVLGFHGHSDNDEQVRGSDAVKTSTRRSDRLAAQSLALPNASRTTIARELKKTRTVPKQIIEISDDDSPITPSSTSDKDGQIASSKAAASRAKDPAHREHVPWAKYTSKSCLQGILDGVVQGPATMLAVPSIPMNKAYSFEYFSLDPKSEPKTYDFVTHSNVAKLEAGVLKNVQTLVENHYINGRPRHHLPAARNPEYTEGASVFFIVDCKEYTKMPDTLIHDIARRRHIVVENTLQQDFAWSRETLMKLGSLSHLRQIQVGQYRGDVKNGLLHVGTLDEMHQVADKRVLLSLSLPLGATPIVSTPRLPDLTSDAWAWHQTAGAAGYPQDPYPGHEMSWGTAGTANAVSRSHLDDAGFFTSTLVLAGKKYWVVFYRDPSLPPHDPKGDMGSTSWAPKYDDFYNHKFEGYFIAEAIEMVPGTLLLQRPNTPHCVLTMEHTITQGHHFYMASCIQDSAHEIVHSFVGRYTVTNQLHYYTMSLFQRMLSASVDYFVNGLWQSGLKLPCHVINVTEVDGLLDMISVGNIVEFAIALDYRTYTGEELDETDVLERETAMSHYRTLIRWFSANYGLLIGDSWVNPSYLFKHRLVSFAASLGDYFTRQHDHVQQQDKMEGINPDIFKGILRHHIQRFWEDILPAYYKLVDKPSCFLYYTGPPFRIIRKSPFRLEVEDLVDRIEECDYAPVPLYIQGKSPREPAIAEVPGHRKPFKSSSVRTTISSPTSPSRQRNAKRRKGGN